MNYFFINIKSLQIALVNKRLNGKLGISIIDFPLFREFNINLIFKVKINKQAQNHILVNFFNVIIQMKSVSAMAKRLFQIHFCAMPIAFCFCYF